MSIYIYVYTLNADLYMYACICMYIYTYTYVNICTFIYMFIFLCVQYLCAFHYFVSPLSPLNCNWLSQGNKKWKFHSPYEVQIVVHMGYRGGLGGERL